MENGSKQKMTPAEAGRLGSSKSKIIQAKQKEERKAKYYENPKRCKECGEVISYEKRDRNFCNSSCSCKWNNEHRKTIKRTCKNCGKEFDARSGFAQYCKECLQKQIQVKIRTEKTKVLYTCQECGKEFEPKHKFNKYCSHECSVKASRERQFEKISNHIKETGEFPAFNGQVIKNETNRKAVRKYLEKTQGHKCAICGLTEWLGQPIPLVVDHIDGNSSNHRVDNFRLICNNCDSLLPTFKGANKGSGRTFRKKYS